MFVAEGDAVGEVDGVSVGGALVVDGVDVAAGIYHGSSAGQRQEGKKPPSSSLIVSPVSTLTLKME